MSRSMARNASSPSVEKISGIDRPRRRTISSSRSMNAALAWWCASEGRATRGTEAGGPSALADGGVSEANSPRGNDPQPQLLIALGGGTLMSEECRELVKRNAKCIYLRAKLETLAENLRADDVAGRPMLAGVNPEAPAESPDSLESRIASMMALRGPIYEKAADIILDIDGLSYEDVAQRVLNL